MTPIPPPGKKAPARCGSRGGAARHRRLKEPVCFFCRVAEARYMAEWRAKRKRQAEGNQGVDV